MIYDQEGGLIVLKADFYYTFTSAKTVQGEIAYYPVVR